MSLHFDAIIFDLDGVITDTASIHSQAWKQTFDDFLKKYGLNKKKHFKKFDIESDYLLYVDGKPRYDGVKSFLESRAIEIPWGNEDDCLENMTICGVGNKKNQLFNRLLSNNKDIIFDSTIKLIHELREHDVKVGVASSSKNCTKILKNLELDYLFEVCVDGNVSAKLGLKGKPAPDIFTHACDSLGVAYHKTAIIEDANSGVKAGKDGNFGLIIGLARHNNHKELKAFGADIVVADLEEINIESINTWFDVGIHSDAWNITYSDFDESQEKSRESLLTVGNGFFATRGCFAEEKASEYHYPGTYFAGVYNKLSSEINGKTIYNEDLVNCPNWLITSFKIDDGDWIDSKKYKILDIERKLDIKKGILTGWVLIEDSAGRQSMIESLRYISMANKNLAGLEYSIIPLNYSGKISIKTGLDANIINDGVERYRELNQKHLNKSQVYYKDKIIGLNTTTTESEIQISVASHVSSNISTATISYEERDSEVHIIYTSEIQSNQEFNIRKIVAFTNSNEKKYVDPDLILNKHNDFNINTKASVNEWKKIWKKCDIKIKGDRIVQQILRLHIYHLFCSVSKHNIDIDASIGARGLHGEAYRGHIFWDELFIFPFYNIHFPEISKQMLLYRFKRLPAAKKYAKENNYAGAMFPWQSGRTGTEETQEIHLNPKSGEWGPDYSRNQRHVSLAIAYNIIRYFETTGDRDFIKNYGFEMICEICRFFTSACEYSEIDKKYALNKVMGPDEFHEKYPNSNSGGLSNNAYTNIMLSWTLKNCLNIYYKIIEPAKNTHISNIQEEELLKWMDISQNLKVNVNNEGIIEQFEGFFKLKELDWENYKIKYNNIYRLDRILKAEGKSPDEYQLAKQADTLMIFYNLTDKELTETFTELGIKLPSDYKIKNFNYYIKRTSHGSSLSRIVHSYLANEWNLKEWATELFDEALVSDYNDIQGGTTAEGIHTGVMAATVIQTISSFAGIDFRSKIISINPKLPDKWDSISFSFLFRQINYQIEINQTSINIKTDADIGLNINSIPCIIEKDEWWNIDY